MSSSNVCKDAFSLNPYLQHLGATPQGLEDESGRIPALLQQIVHCHPVPHAANCCLFLPLMDTAAKIHPAVGRLADLDV